MKIDFLLIQQLEELCDGESVHLHANLVGTYRIAVAEFAKTKDLDYRNLAQEAERALRSQLSRQRLKKAGGLVQWV